MVEGQASTDPLSEGWRRYDLPWQPPDLLGDVVQGVYGLLLHLMSPSLTQPAFASSIFFRRFLRARCWMTRTAGTLFPTIWETSR
jgi:hypothetical protein